MIIYDGNYDTAGTKTLAYDASTMLPEYNEVFDYGQGGMEFAGWSTKQQAASEAEVYQPGTLVTDVNWETTDTPKPLYAQWKKTAAQRPVADPAPVEPIDPVEPADPFDPDAPPAELDELFGVDPDAAFDAAPDPLPEELDDVFSVDPGGDADAPLPR